MPTFVKIHDTRLNADNISNYAPAADDAGKTCLRLTDGTVVIFDISPEELDKLIAAAREEKHDNAPLIRRLTEAIDRLSMRIPSSIRMHM